MNDTTCRKTVPFIWYPEIRRHGISKQNIFGQTTKHYFLRIFRGNNNVIHLFSIPIICFSNVCYRERQCIFIFKKYRNRHQKQGALLNIGRTNFNKLFTLRFHKLYNQLNKREDPIWYGSIVVLSFKLIYIVNEIKTMFFEEEVK